jgi:hypothetical protein
VTELKSTRFLSTSSRQVDLTLKPTLAPALEANTSNSSRRRHSESSAPLILQQTTPTKSKKSAQSSSFAPNLADYFVILETPPRALSKQIPQNDLTSSVRRLFSSQQQMEE